MFPFTSKKKKKKKKKTKKTPKSLLLKKFALLLPHATDEDSSIKEFSNHIHFSTHSL